MQEALGCGPLLLRGEPPFPSLLLLQRNQTTNRQFNEITCIEFLSHDGERASDYATHSVLPSVLLTPDQQACPPNHTKKMSLYPSPMLTRGSSIEEMQWMSVDATHKSRQGSTENLFQLLSLPPLPGMDQRFSRSQTIVGLEDLVDLGTAVPCTPVISPPTPNLSQPSVFQTSPTYQTSAQTFVQPEKASPVQTVQPSQLHQPTQTEALRLSILRHLPQFFPVTADPAALSLNALNSKMDTLQFAPSVMPNLLQPTLIQSNIQSHLFSTQYGGHSSQMGNIVSQFQLGLTEPVGLGIPLYEKQRPREFTSQESFTDRDGKPKRKKTTEEQLQQLLAVFQVTDTPGFDMREDLARKTGMTNREVQVCSMMFGANNLDLVSESSCQGVSRAKVIPRKSPAVHHSSELCLELIDTLCNLFAELPCRCAGSQLRRTSPSNPRTFDNHGGTQGTKQIHST